MTTLERMLELGREFRARGLPTLDLAGDENGDDTTSNSTLAVRTGAESGYATGGVRFARCGGGVRVIHRRRNSDWA